MGSRQVTIELPDDVYERVVDASRQAGAPLDATIVDLVERGLASDPSAASTRASDAMLDEFHRAQAALRERIRQGIDMSDLRRRVFDPEEAARLRDARPRLDPPISRTVIEDREDRV